MEKLQFEFKVVAAEGGKSNVLAITSISTQDNKKYYIPEEESDVYKHELLVATSNFVKIKKSLKKRHQTRNIWITLTKEMKDQYFDEDGNLQFNDQYLEEVNTLNENPMVQNDSLSALLEKIFENTQKSEEKKVSSIIKEFTVEKFNSKTTNANQWINEFEKECAKFEIEQDRKKIDALKFFLDKPYLNWYSNTMLKLPTDAEWNDWKKNFCETFANKGWSPIRFAFHYKYQIGNLVDYAIKKEKLLLEVRKDIDIGTLIDLIAIGLPNFIADKIDRETIESTEELCNELGKLEHCVLKKTTNKIPSTYDNQKKVPCKICKDNGKGNRFHPENKCWFNRDEHKLENTSLLDVVEFQEKKN
ncbi:uncharacterized protein LOC123302367 [Chrysoperla carnea]|uniref:uncharacterized protein LOC123302367 n=1 Tax=Chrysoperla carnea TaxID=189513 RepID=UPI001D068A9A|nr:uncharacterized protein LOC123302367 [Chrysoperla carnea]